MAKNNINRTADTCIIFNPNSYNEQSKALDALQQLELDSNAKVKCPECIEGFPGVKDEHIPGWDKIDRYLICDRCGSYNIATKSMSI